MTSPNPDGPTGSDAEKFVLKSRAFWAMIAPVLALGLQQTGVGPEVFGSADKLVTAFLAVVGAGAWFWHHLAPSEKIVVGLIAKLKGGGA